MRNSGLFAAHGLEIENAVHLDGPTTSERLPNNAKAVCHQSEAVHQQRRSGSPTTQRAVHQQYQKQFNARSSHLLATVSYKSSIQALPSRMALRPATCNRQSLANSLSPELIRTLNTEAQRLHLDRHNLVTTSKRQELMERLLQWHTASHQVAESNSQEGGSESDPELNHTRTVSGSQENSSSSDRGNNDAQADSLSKEARSPDEDGCYTRGQHPNTLKRHYSHHQREEHASRHQQHRSYHQREWAHTSSHYSNHQRDRGPIQMLKHSPTPLASKYRHRLTLPLSTELPLKISTPQHIRRTRHAQHSSSSSAGKLIQQPVVG